MDKKKSLNNENEQLISKTKVFHPDLFQNIQEVYENSKKGVVVNLIADFGGKSIPFYAQKVFTSQKSYN